MSTASTEITAAQIAEITAAVNFPSNLHWLVLGTFSCALNNSGPAKIKLWDRIRAMSEKDCRAVLKPAKQTWVVLSAKGELLHFVFAKTARLALAMFQSWAAAKGRSFTIGAVMDLPRWSHLTGLTKATSGYGHIVLK